MARAEEYGGTLYQRLVAVVVGLVLVAGTGAGAAAAAERSTDFRISHFEHVRGVSHLTVVAPPALGEDPPPADQIEVLDPAQGFPLDAQVARLPAVPLEVVLVADVSGGPASVEAIQGALREFVLSLPEASAVTVVAAGEKPHLVASLTRSPDAALAGVALLSPGKPGLTEGAIDLGLDQLTGTPGTRPVVVEVRTGSYRSATGATTPLDATRDRLAEEGVDVYAVHLGTQLPSAPTLPVPTGGGFVLQASSTSKLLGGLDTIARDLSLPRYRVDVFGLEDPAGVQVSSDWHGVHSEVVTVAGPPPAKAPPERPAPAGPPIAKLAALAGAIVLVTIVVLVPPARRRRRAKREAALPPRPVGLPIDPRPVASAAAAPAAAPSGMGGEDVEGLAAVRALLTEGSRPVSEVWVADDVEPAVRAELAELAAGRRVPVRSGLRPGSALPVAARAAPLGTVGLGTLWSRGARPVVLAVAGRPSPAGLGSVLRAAGDGGTALAGVVLPRLPSSRVTAATAAAAAGAIERLPLALVPDLGAALGAARAAGVRVVGVVRTGPGGGRGSALDEQLQGPSLVVVSATGELDRSLRARCDTVVPLEGDGPTGQVEALVAALTTPAPDGDVDLRDAVHARSGWD